MKVNMIDVIIMGFKETFAPHTFSYKFIVTLGIAIVTMFNLYVGFQITEAFLAETVPIIFGTGLTIIVMFLFVIEIMLLNIGKQYRIHKNMGFIK